MKKDFETKSKFNIYTIVVAIVLCMIALTVFSTQTPQVVELYLQRKINQNRALFAIKVHLRISGNQGTKKSTALFTVDLLF